MKLNGFDDWDFAIDEVSNSVYQITAIDKYGHRIQLTGTDLDDLLSECTRTIENIKEKAE